MCVDATHCGNFSRYFNHSHDPNLFIYTIQNEEASAQLGHICFFANREIQPFEELTFNYGYQRTSDTALQIACLCGARHCPGWLR